MTLKTIAYSYVTLQNEHSQMYETYEVLFIKNKILFIKTLPYAAMSASFDINERLNYTLDYLDINDPALIEGYDTIITIYSSTNNEKKLYLKLSINDKLKLNLINNRTFIQRDYKTIVSIIVPILLFFLGIYYKNTNDKDVMDIKTNIQVLTNKLQLTDSMLKSQNHKRNTPTDSLIQEILIVLKSRKS